MTEVQKASLPAKKLPGMWGTLVIMYKTEGGFLALYRGIIPTVAGVAPYVGHQPLETSSQLTFSGWTQLHDIRIGPSISHSSRRSESLESSKAVGRCYFRCRRSDLHVPIVSSICRGHRYSTSLTSYSDVLRRRFQINTMSGLGYQYTSMWDAVSKIVAKEGVLGMYKGLLPNLLKVAPSMASSWLSFELTRDFFLAMGHDEGEAT